MIASIEDTNLLPEIQELLKDILYNESLSENAVRKLGQLIEKLDAVLTPPSSTRISVKSGPVFQANAEVFNITSQEFLKEQRELSRQGTVWKGYDFIPESARLSDNSSKKSPQVIKKSEGEKGEEFSLKYDKDAIYEKIDSCGVEQKSLQNTKRISQVKASIPIRLDNPPPVPERKGRLTSYERNVASPIPDRHRSSNKDLVWVHDLQTPLYSGLLRNVRSNTKQWCVIKRHILYLFNDLNEPASFMADLHEYEVFKDPEEPLMFRVSRLGEPSVVLAAVDEKQYQLWLHAFRNAKFLVDSEDGRLDNAGELGDYSEFKDSVGFDEEDCSDDDADYEKPDEMMDKLKHTVSSEVYEVMTGYDTSGVAPQTSFNYEEIGCPAAFPVRAKITIDDNTDYSAMPLPPIPDVLPPKLPPRITRLPLDINNDSESDSSDGSLSGSFDSFSAEEISFALDQNLTYNQVKSKRKKEFDFFHDLSAVFCGILHQRRMLAVWQKRFCKVKDQCLFCYRSLDVTEPCLRVQLHGYQLDRAEETWKSFAFKMYKDNSDVYYFAAESRSDLIKWLSVLAKETNKEKFLPVDGLERRRAYTTVENYSENNTSNESLSFSRIIVKKSSTDINTSSEFENDSIDSEENNISKIQKQKSLDNPDVVMQGFLLRKFQTHWSRRWCCIKNERFFSYKQSPNDHPDVKILLKHAVLTIPHNKVDANEVNSCFQLHYEGNQTIVLNAISKEDWLAWTNTLKKFVASESEEKFPYANAPPLSRSLSDSLKVASQCEINIDAAENSYYPISDEPPLSVALIASKALVFDNPPRSETEVKDSIYCSMVTELKALKQSFQHIEHFLVLTKEKWLKFYGDVNATVPRTQYNARNIQVIDEIGADPLILRLHIELQNKEVTLKTNSARECENWKNAFLKVHYEQIDTDDILNGKLTENLILPPRVTKSGEPLLLSLNKNLLNPKKMKEQNADPKYPLEKSKSLPRQSIVGTRKPSLDPILSTSKEDKQTLTDQQKKSFSALIRSFTVDTLTRKNKNKSYVVNKEDSPLVKETQRGHLKQVIVKNMKENLEDRFCRISGKVFYCFKCESDLKPLFKIPLKNAAIEEFSDVDTPQFRFQVTDLDSGKEYLFSLGSDFELNQWTTALFGDDKLHWSHSSPINSDKILPASNLDTGDRTSKALSSIPVKSIDASVLLDSPSTCSGDSLNTQQDPVNSLDGEKIISGPNVKKTTICDSSSSVNSLLENSSDMKNSALRLVKRTGNEEIRLQGYFFETTENSHVQRWLVLKDTILEIFSDIHDQQPISTIQFSSHFIMSDDNESSSTNSICLKDEKNSFYIFVASADVDCQLWKSELKAIQAGFIQSRGLNHEVTSIPSVTLRKKQRKLSKHKQASILLLNDDLKVLQKYERCEDPSNISGGLTELFPCSNQKWKKHDRFCWICQGVFYVSKLNNPKKTLKSIDLSGVSVMDESDPASARFAFRLDYKQDNKPKFALFQTSNQSLAEKWMVAVSVGILFHRLSGTIDRKSFKNEDTHEDFEFFDFSKSSVERTSEFDPLESRNLKKEISKEMTENEADPKDIRLLVEVPPSEKPNQPLQSSSESSFVTAVSLSESNLSQNVESKKSELFTNKREQTDNQVVSLTSDALNLTLINNTGSAMSCGMNSLEENKFSVSNDNINDLGELLDNIPEKENADETFKNIKGILRQQESIRRAILKRQSTKLKKPPPKIKPKPIRLSASKLILPTTALHGTADFHLVDMEKYKEKLENERESLINCIKDMNNAASDSKTQMLNSRGVIGESISSNELKVSLEDLEKLRARLHQIEIELKSVYKNINRKVATNIRESNTFDKTISRTALHLHKTLSNTPSVPFEVNKEGCLSESIIENDEVLLCNPIEELSNTQSIII